MMNYKNIQKIIKTIGDIAGAVSLITGVAGVGFKIKDAFTEHRENKSNLELAESQTVDIEVSNEDTDIISEEVKTETIEE